MDLSVIFQLRTKRFWWMDVILYFVISLLIATVFCYVIFLIKDGIQVKDIQEKIIALRTVGTESQKAQEKEVIGYQTKINDFSGLLNNHTFASNVFAFLESQTIPNVWYKQFSFDKKSNGVQVSGESDDLDSVSRQMAVFENADNKKYVKSVGNVNTLLGEGAKVEFNTSLVLSQNVFNYLTEILLVPNTTTSPETSPTQQNQPAPVTPTVPANNANPPATANASANASAPTTPEVKSSENLITSFHLLLNPEVVGQLDETNYKVTLNVPYGTDLKNIASSIVISPKATVMPASGVSQDFTNPVIYTVTAENGSTQNYEVKVIVGAQPVVKKSNQSEIILIVMMLVGVIIILTVAIILVFLRIKAANKKTQIQ